MPVFWVGIEGTATPEQHRTLTAAGMRCRGEGGKRHRATGLYSFFEVETETEENAIERVGEALPELRTIWAEKPPRVIPPKNE